MPSWMYLLANKAMNRGAGLEEFDVVIPYLSIVVSLLSIAVPQCIGLTIAAYRKPIADKIRYMCKSITKYFSKERYNTHAKSCNSILYKKLTIPPI